jgi:thioredoxin 1
MKTLKYISIFMLCIIFVVNLSFAGAIVKPSGKKTDKALPNQYSVTFVELGSVNCVPCKMMQPVMKDIENKYQGQVKVIFYDVWKEENRLYAEKYKIRAIPTQVFLDKNGREFFRHEGFYPTEEIIKVLSKQGIKQADCSAKTPEKTDNTGTKMQSGEVCK